MNSAINNWKNASVFRKQLELNRKELQNFPAHWNDFCSAVHFVNPKTVLDFGCGCGALSEVCKLRFPDLKYKGCDYAQEAVELARKEWGGDFFVKDINDITKEELDCELIHLGALLDVLPNADEILERLLSYSLPKMLIGRIEFTKEDSYYINYTAYSEIDTFRFHHSAKKFEDLLRKYNYTSIMFGNTVLLSKNLDFACKWSTDYFIGNLDEFNELYASRPIKDNNGGMKSPHMFNAWSIIKELQPKTIIESGVWKGQGTWFFEKASPDSKIISIDPSPQFRVYSSNNAVYTTEDFLTKDWSHINKEDCLVFFDDHQDFVQRLRKCKELGFKHIMTEDNYTTQQGDCLTPKKVISGLPYVIDRGGRREWFRENPEDLKFFRDNVKIYQELQPIFRSDITRWGDSWDFKYLTPPPLLEEVDKEKYPEFWQESKDYTWICYIELI